MDRRSGGNNALSAHTVLTPQLSDIRSDPRYRALLNHHYENMSMQYTEIFKLSKMKIFSRKSLIFFLFLLKT